MRNRPNPFSLNDLRAIRSISMLHSPKNRKCSLLCRYNNANKEIVIRHLDISHFGFWRFKDETTLSILPKPAGFGQILLSTSVSL